MLCAHPGPIPHYIRRRAPPGARWHGATFYGAPGGRTRLIIARGRIGEHLDGHLDEHPNPPHIRTRGPWRTPLGVATFQGAHWGQSRLIIVGEHRRKRPATELTYTLRKRGSDKPSYNNNNDIYNDDDDDNSNNNDHKHNNDDDGNHIQ